MPSSLDSCKPCACYHNLGGFVCVSFLIMLKKDLLPLCFPSPLVFTFSAYFSAEFPEPWREGFEGDTPFNGLNVLRSLALCSFSNCESVFVLIYCICSDLFVLIYCIEDLSTSLMMAGQDPWSMCIKKKWLKVTLLLWLFFFLVVFGLPPGIWPI